MTQRRCILATLKRFLNKSELEKIGLYTSPMEASVALTCTTSELPPVELTEMQSVPYREAIIGSLLWLVAGTRADIAFLVQTCAKFCSNPIRHRKAGLRILLYLHRTINYGLAF